MSGSRRTLSPHLLAFLAPLCMLAAACTGQGKAASTSRPTPSSSPTASLTVITPGSYEYTNVGLTVTLKLHGHAGTLKVQNQTGRELAKPDLYVLNATDGHRVDGTVESPASIANGETKTFAVEFPAEVEPKTIGLVILLIGKDNYGAFAPA